MGNMFFDDSQNREIRHAGKKEGVFQLCLGNGQSIESLHPSGDFWSTSIFGWLSDKAIIIQPSLSE